MFKTVLLLYVCFLKKADLNQGTNFYEITLKTGNHRYAGTSAQIHVQLYGNKNNSSKIILQTTVGQITKDSTVKFRINVGSNIGVIRKLEVGHDNTGSSAGWLLNEVKVLIEESSKAYYFPVHKWLSEKSGTSILAQVNALDRDNCGITASSKMINGIESTSNAWPWMARLVAKDTKNLIECGSTLIHPEYVLTAAHCLLYYKSARNYHLTLGEHDHTKNEGSEQYIDVAELIVHPKYNATINDNDIAILKLKRPAKINKFVKLACLPTKQEYVKPGLLCISTGWGQNSQFLPTASKRLEQTNLPSISQSECQLHYVQTISQNMLCAGGKKQGLCVGDSGGPLICKNRNDRYDVHGVASFVAGSCDPVAPAVFSRVSENIDWIESMISTTVEYL